MSLYVKLFEQKYKYRETKMILERKTQENIALSVKKGTGSAVRINAHQIGTVQLSTW